MCLGKQKTLSLRWYLPSVPAPECQVLSSAFKSANVFMGNAVLPAHQYYLGTGHVPISVYLCARYMYVLYICLYIYI